MKRFKFLSVSLISSTIFFTLWFWILSIDIISQKPLKDHACAFALFLFIIISFAAFIYFIIRGIKERLGRENFFDLFTFHVLLLSSTFLFGCFSPWVDVFSKEVIFFVLALFVLATVLLVYRLFFRKFIERHPTGFTQIFCLSCIYVIALCLCIFQFFYFSMWVLIRATARFFIFLFFGL